MMTAGRKDREKLWQEGGKTVARRYKGEGKIEGGR
jgi:hypothetical protein